MSKTGKESFKRRIKELAIEKVDLQQAATARLILLQYTKDQVYNVSTGATTFFIWVRQRNLISCNNMFKFVLVHFFVMKFSFKVLIFPSWNYFLVYESIKWKVMIFTSKNISLIVCFHIFTGAWHCWRSEGQIRAKRRRLQ